MFILIQTLSLLSETHASGREWIKSESLSESESQVKSDH